MQSIMQPAANQIDWDDPQAKDALVSALVGDAKALLALVAGRDVEPAEGSDGTDGRWRTRARSARTG